MGMSWLLVDSTIVGLSLLNVERASQIDPSDQGFNFFFKKLFGEADVGRTAAHVPSCVEVVYVCVCIVDNYNDYSSFLRSGRAWEGGLVPVAHGTKLC
jgi:predicted acetyltransferase